MTINYKGSKPIKASDGANGYDLTATSVETIRSGRHPILVFLLKLLGLPTGEKIIYGTNTFISPEETVIVLALNRSSVHKKNLRLTNGLGLIDNDYRGEIKFIFDVIGNKNNVYEIGDRIGQLVFIQPVNINWKYSNNLSITERGTNGFGSTGN